MNSFYGGREGAPFILRKSYPNVPAMLDDFKQGLAFTEVRFGEYVIINTESKNHPDNGKVFRRNFAGGQIKYWKKNESKKIFEEIEKEESAYGAELIGSIVGPAGSVPYFQAVPFKLNEDDNTLVTMGDIKTQYENELFDTQRSCGSFNLTDENLIPGAYIENGEQKFNDEIKWDSFSVRTPDADDATAFIEFKVPYNVIDFEANQVNAYTAPTVEKMLAEDEPTHPFYQKWQINIPKGIKGASISNIRTEAASENIVTLSEGENGELIINRYEEDEDGVCVSQAYDGQQEDIERGYEIFVADVTYYDNKEEGETYPVYVGDYKVIKKVNFWPESGIFQIFCSHQEHIAEHLVLLKRIDMAADGTVKFVTTDAETNEQSTFEKAITWISNYNYDSSTGLLTIELNNDSHGSQNSEINLKTPNRLYTEEDGTFKVDYNTGETATLGGFFYQGDSEEEAAAALTVGGLWIDVVEV